MLDTAAAVTEIAHAEPPAPPALSLFICNEVVDETSTAFAVSLGATAAPDLPSRPHDWTFHLGAVSGMPRAVERQLLEEIAALPAEPQAIRKGSAQAVQLLNAHKRYIFLMATRMAYRHNANTARQQKPSVTVDDYMQDGCLGFLHAIWKYDATRNTRLLTYATRWIQAFIQDGTSRDTVALVSHEAVDEGLHDAVFNYGLDHPTARYHFASDKRSLRAKLERVARGLEPRERYILERRYFDVKQGEEPPTLKQLAVELKMTREWVRQLEQRALSKLRKVLKDR